MDFNLAAAGVAVGAFLQVRSLTRPPRSRAKRDDDIWSGDVGE
jgi:hypothetical protein